MGTAPISSSSLQNTVGVLHAEETPESSSTQQASNTPDAHHHAHAATKQFNALLSRKLLQYRNTPGTTQNNTIGPHEDEENEDQNEKFGNHLSDIRRLSSSQARDLRNDVEIQAQAEKLSGGEQEEFESAAKLPEKVDIKGFSAKLDELLPRATEGEQDIAEGNSVRARLNVATSNFTAVASSSHVTSQSAAQALAPNHHKVVEFLDSIRSLRPEQAQALRDAIRNDPSLRGQVESLPQSVKHPFLNTLNSLETHGLDFSRLDSHWQAPSLAQLPPLRQLPPLPPSRGEKVKHIVVTALMDDSAGATTGLGLPGSLVSNGIPVEAQLAQAIPSLPNLTNSSLANNVSNYSGVVSNVLGAGADTVDLGGAAIKAFLAHRTLRNHDASETEKNEARDFFSQALKPRTILARGTEQLDIASQVTSAVGTLGAGVSNQAPHVGAAVSLSVAGQSFDRAWNAHSQKKDLNAALNAIPQDPQYDKIRNAAEYAINQMKTRRNRQLAGGGGALIGAGGSIANATVVGAVAGLPMGAVSTAVSTGLTAVKAVHYVQKATAGTLHQERELHAANLWNELGQDAAPAGDTTSPKYQAQQVVNALGLDPDAVRVMDPQKGLGEIATALVSW